MLLSRYVILNPKSNLSFVNMGFCPSNQQYTKLEYQKNTNILTKNSSALNNMTKATINLNKNISFSKGSEKMK